MDSLTTAYLVCMLIGSGCAVGGAFVGNKVVPIESSSGSVQQLTTEEDENKNLKIKEILTGQTIRLYNPPFDQHDKLLYIESSPDSFFEEQMKFFSSLSNLEKTILVSFVTEGYKIVRDVKHGYGKSILDSIISIDERMKRLYGNDTVEKIFGTSEITLSNIKSLSISYLNKVFDIIFRLPPVKTPFKVFIFTNGSIEDFKGVVFTTYDPMSPMLKKQGSSTVYELTVMPGNKPLFVDPLYSGLGTSANIILTTGSSINLGKTTTKEIWDVKDETSPITKYSKKVIEGTVILREGFLNEAAISPPKVEEPAVSATPPQNTAQTLSSATPSIN